MSDSEETKYDSPQMKNEAMDLLTGVITSALKFKASDIHIRVGHNIMMRLDGRMRTVAGSPEMTATSIEALMFPLMSTTHLEAFKENKQVDLSLTDTKENRVRVNLFTELGSPAIVMRVIEKTVASPEALGLPKQVESLYKMRQGLVIFSGATGSGKSSSIAAILQLINLERYHHILTIEDPVETVFKEERCVISQREVGTDVPNFSLAMKAALREDPDVILMGEMRDAESIEIALTAAETGHLVFTTLHAPNSSDAITRIVSSFPGDEQTTIRAKLAYNLRAVVTQRLLPKKEGKGRAAACEVFSVTPLARELITDPVRSKEIKDLIRGEDTVAGMLYFDHHLDQLVKDDIISEKIALANASSPTDLALRFKGY